MHVPHIHVGADVGEAELAEQPFPFIAELRLDPSGMRAELIAHLRNGHLHGFDVEPRPAKPAAVLDEFPRHLVAEDAKDEIDRILKEGAVGP